MQENEGLRTLGELIEFNARRCADAVAMIYQGKPYTYGALHRRTSRLANALLDMGAKRQSRVAILAKNSNCYVETYAACQKVGLITVAINYRLSPEEIAYVVRDSSPMVILFDQEYSETVDRLRPGLADTARFVCIGNEAPEWSFGYENLLAGASIETPPLKARPEDIAYLIYTSGTTGRPKGAMLDHAGQLRFIQIQAAEMRMRGSDRMLLTMPFYHIGATCNYLACLLFGGTAIIHRTYDIDEVVRDIETHKVTVVHLAPIMVQDLVDTPEADLSSLRLVQYASGPMPVAQLRRAAQRFGPIFAQVYGMTETGSASVLHPWQHVLEGSDEWVRRLGSAGQETVGYKVRVVRRDGSDCDPEEIGEILIKGPGVMVGYWNNHPATLDALEDGWMRSGDLGLFDKDRFLFVVDRKKDMIISGGENIYPREVEEALAAHPAVREVAVIGVPDERWGEAVKAFVVPEGNATVDEATLIDFCRTRIASYKKPKSVEIVTALPRLPNKKVDKVALRDPFWKRLSRNVN